MPTRGEQHAGVVVVREDGVHARQGFGLRRVDRHDAGVRVRAAEDREVQQPLRPPHVERVLLASGHDRHRRRGGDRRADRLTGRRAGRVRDPVQGVLDRPVPGAPAEVALQRTVPVGQGVLVERGRRDDVPGGAEAALEARGLGERTLHGVRVLRRAEPRRRGDGTTRHPVRRRDAGVDRHTVDEHRARTAVARVAALLHGRHPVLAEQGAEDLTGLRFGVHRRAVDLEPHAAPPVVPSASATSSAANRRLTARRQSGEPCGSSYQASWAASRASTSAAVGTPA